MKQTLASISRRIEKAKLISTLSITLIFTMQPHLAEAQTDCGWNPDYNDDNHIGIADLLGLLGVFEEIDTDGDGIFDSVDDCVGTIDPCGECNGNGTDNDSDGICDDLDNCIGELDECGICNGPGPTIENIESIELIYDSVFIPENESWHVFLAYSDTTFILTCPPMGCTDETAFNFDSSVMIDDGSCLFGPPQCNGLDSIQYYNYYYSLVAIGDDCWFAENLRNDKYSNGDPIPGELSGSEWSNSLHGAQAIVGEGESACIGEPCDAAISYEKYGRLYNWLAVDDQRGLCPDSWHISTDDDWKELEMTLGMSMFEIHNVGFRGTNEGAKLKSSTNDTPAWDGLNSCGFSGLPSGMRSVVRGMFFNSGVYDNSGSLGVWTSSLSNASFPYARFLYNGDDRISRLNSDPRNGYSVRCVLDCVDLDTDGICDDIDDCIGLVDVIGICNGTCLADEDSDGVCDDEDPCIGVLDICGICNGSSECTEFFLDTDDDGILDHVTDPCLGQTSINYQGFDYGLIGIFGTCWFAENLVTDRSRLGTQIEYLSDLEDWNNNFGSPAFTYYEGAEANGDVYGALYNAFVTTEEFGVCPEHWSVPSLSQWSYLSESLYENNMTGGDLKNIGSFYWQYPNTGATNSTGFSALPGGTRGPYEIQDEGIGQISWFWAKSEDSSFFTHAAGLNFSDDSLRIEMKSPSSGLSVRCLFQPILGCTLEEFIEFDPSAIIDDGSCQTQSIEGCTDDRFIEFDPLANTDDDSCTNLLGCSSHDTLFVDGNQHLVVTIGEQCWFKENLNTTTYSDGSTIPEIESNSIWDSLTTGGQCSWGNNEINSMTYGRIYNWHAINDERGICPAGWHVPSDDEWKTLEIELGMSPNEASTTGYRGSPVGNSLKASPFENPNWDGTNSSGFTGIRGGYRNSGSFYGLGEFAYWWSSTVNGQSAWYRRLHPGYSTVLRSSNYMDHAVGMSVRCLRNE